MSINYYGKCDNCGKSNQRITFHVRVHDIPGTNGFEECCIKCVQGNGDTQGAERKLSKSRS